MASNVYLDNAASAPLDERVAAVMDRTARLIGNPSAVHADGRHLRQLVDRARLTLAGLLEVPPSEIHFTSGATEANNLAVRGLFAAANQGADRPGRILASPIEHPSVLETLRWLAGQAGAAVDWLPVDRAGRVSAEDVARLLTEDTCLVCVMWVNNVLGSVQPVEEIGQVVAEARAARQGERPLRFFSDAVQALAHLPIRPRSGSLDAVTVSGHKIHGPKGVGALWLRRGSDCQPLLHGGGQEAGLRPGTENVSGIVGLGEAADILARERDEAVRAIGAVRERFLSALAGLGRRIRVLSPTTGAAPHLVYLQLAGLDGETAVLKLDAAGVSVSSGTACEAGHRSDQSVLRAVFGGRTAKQGGIRVSFSRLTTPADIDRLVETLRTV